MQYLNRYFLLGVLFLTQNSAFAFEESVFWQKVQILAEKCVIQPYSISISGKKKMHRMVSYGSEIQLVSSDTVKIQLEENVFFAILKPSKDADPFSEGGDINDLEIQNSEGNVLAHYPSILAFGDPLYALVGNNERIATQEEK